MSAEAPAAPTLVVLAGPNGAGKSTYFELFLRATGLRFVNADLIARAIAPEDPAAAAYEAAQAADLERRLLVSERESFCMETVFSDPAGDKVAFLREARGAGYRVHLVFLGLDTPALSEARVIQRVEAGGHDVPSEKLTAGFPRTLVNLAGALPVVDSADLFDNSDAEHPYRLVASFEAGHCAASSPPIPGWAVNLVQR